MKAAALFLLVGLLTGCAGVENIRDDDLSQGCGVYSGLYNGSFVNGAISGCKFKCSQWDELPPGFKFSYNSGGCNINVHK